MFGASTRRPAVQARWPRTAATPTLAWLAAIRSPLPILVAGAEGGVGTTTVASMLGETFAACSAGPTVVVDQCGSPRGSLSRRLLGHRREWTTWEATRHAREGAVTARIAGAAPTSHSGAVVLADHGHMPLRTLMNLVYAPCGVLVLDGGQLSTMLVAHLDLPVALVLVGRADVIGAEAVCAALGLLADHDHPWPCVVLADTTRRRRQVQAARALLTASGPVHHVALPNDPVLASGHPLHFNRLGRASSAVCLWLVTSIALASASQYPPAR